MSNFDTWLNFFMIDNNISMADTVYEGIVDGKMKHVTYREFFEAIKPYPMIQDRVRNDLSVALFTGGSFKSAVSKVCEEELIEKGHSI